MRYAEIVVNVPTAPTWSPDNETAVPAAPYRWTDLTFTYEVPEELRGSITPGQMVWVPFRSRQLQAMVVGLSDKSSVEGIRPILSIVHDRPLLSPAQLALARWISHRYLAPLSECIWLLLPPGITEKIETVYQESEEHKEDETLTENQRAVLERARGARGVKSTQLAASLRSAAETLVKRGYLVKTARLAQASARPKQVKTVRLRVTVEQANSLLANRPGKKPSARLARIVEFLRADSEPVWISAVYAATDANLQDLKRLEETGIVTLDSEEVVRDSLSGRTYEPGTPPALTGEQSHALAQIKEGLKQDRPKAYLLHGVTGSGKTEIYLRAIETVLAQERQAIALVPEIALTPQTIQRFGARFDRIAIIHSDLSHGERYDTWRRARDGKIDVVIGPRSALFCPLPRLGLIVVDEEHEPSYKQEANTHLRLPAYHTREVALELARESRASVIMGSATPDVETYWRARNGDFSLIELPRRILAHGAGDAPVRFQDLPPVQIVDLRAELRAGNTSVFSRDLDFAMRTALAAKQQVILFLNRRGAATSVVCRDCGEPVRCPRCNNPFTQHEFQGRPSGELVCHHCGKRRQMPRTCPACGSKRIRGLGLGTEKLEQLVRAQFPGARTLRWDTDVTHGYESHETILEAFKHGEADILIGTQMIAKGLDLPRVTLVGVVNADTGLNLPDFRAGERTFQLLTQVAGRAGRSELGGKVIIQTFHPENYAIRAAAGHDYAQFFGQEMSFRQSAAYPPFRPLVRLILTGTPEAPIRESAEQLAVTLRDRIRRTGLGDVEVIGPAPAFYAKWGGNYRYHLLLKGRDSHALLAELPLPQGWRIDVDPLSIL